MIDQYLLTELVAFYHYKTLAKTAHQLHLTQPTLSRGMQKLEQQLGVKLFERQPNRLTFTRTGVFAAQEAAKLLKAEQDFTTRVHNFARELEEIKIGATLPGPLLALKRAQRQLPNNWFINSPLLPLPQIKSLLLKREYSLIFANHEVRGSNIATKLIGIEELMVSLPQEKLAAEQTSVTFHDLQNLTFVVSGEIGPWRSLIQKALPQANLMFQEEDQALQELITNTAYPYFKTNFSWNPAVDNQKLSPGRRLVPLRDPVAKMPIYANYLKDLQIDWEIIWQIMERVKNYHENYKKSN